MSSFRQRASRLSKRLEVPVDENLDDARPTAWNNRDLAPLPPSRRTWTVWGFLGFWAVIQLNTVGWQTASSLISLGLSVWEAMIVTIIAKVSSAVVIFPGRLQLTLVSVVPDCRRCHHQWLVGSCLACWFLSWKSCRLGIERILPCSRAKNHALPRMVCSASLDRRTNDRRHVVCHLQWIQKHTQHVSRECSYDDTAVRGIHRLPLLPVPLPLDPSGENSHPFPLGQYHRSHHNGFGHDLGAVNSAWRRTIAHRQQHTEHNE